MGSTGHKEMKSAFLKHLNPDFKRKRSYTGIALPRRLVKNENESKTHLRRRRILVMNVRLSETGKSQSKPLVFLRHADNVSVKFTLSLMSTLPRKQIQKDGGIVTGGNVISLFGSLPYPL